MKFKAVFNSRCGASMALAYATSDIGAHHTRAWTIAKEIGQGQDWTDEERVDLVMYHQALRPLFDMLGVCRLPWIKLGGNEAHYPKFYTHTTGDETSLEELLKKSDNLYKLTRLIDTRLGMSRRDDTLPFKVAHAPIQAGPTSGQYSHEEEFQKILDLYYQKRGWDENGIPSAELEENFL